MSCNSEALLVALADGASDLSRGDDWPDCVDPFLARLGQAMGASRVWIGQLITEDDTAIYWDYVREWTARPRWAKIGNEDSFMLRACLQDPDYARITEERRNGHAHILHARDLTGDYGQRFEAHQTQSCITAPIIVEGRWWGTIGVDDCENDRSWTKSSVAAMRAASKLIGSCILRHRLLDKRGQFELVLRATGAGYWDIDLERQRHWWSPELLRLLGLNDDRDDMSLRDVIGQIHPQDRCDFNKAIRRTLSGEQQRLRVDLRIKRCDGSYIWLEMLGYLTRDQFGTPTRLAGIAIDIQNRKREEMELREQATFDPLTGALNRRAFDYTAAMEQSRCSGLGLPLSVLVLDLDHFKVVNDTHGHAVGDHALHEFAELCRAGLRDCDVFGRIGGEEFAVVLPGAGLATAHQIAERIRLRVEHHTIDTKSGPLQLTVSIGVTEDRHAQTDIEQLVDRADNALYRAKRSGRNQLHVA